MTVSERDAAAAFSGGGNSEARYDGPRQIQVDQDGDGNVDQAFLIDGVTNAGLLTATDFVWRATPATDGKRSPKQNVRSEPLNRWKPVTASVTGHAIAVLAHHASQSLPWAMVTATHVRQKMAHPY